MLQAGHQFLERPADLDIHGEVLMLGFDGSERATSRWMRRATKDPERAKSLDAQG